MTDWDQIIRQDGPAVWRTAYRLLGHRADAEECFQEAFVAALEVERRAGLTSPRALLLRMVTARAMDRLRQRYRRRRREHADADWSAVVGAGGAPSQHAEAAELSERLREALAALPANQADAFSLCCLEGWTYQDAAVALRLSPQNVGVLVHRARGKLRDVFGPVEANGVHHD